jgi:phenolic acid decarboxylase
MADKELGSAVFCSGEDAWVEVNGVTVAFYSKYNDYAFTQARKMVSYLNDNPEQKQMYYNDAVKKLYEDGNNGN